MSDTQYEPRPLSPDEYKSWDGLIERSQRGTLFHQTLWLGAFERPFVIIGCYDNGGQLAGGMPLPYQQAGRIKIGRPPYLTPYLGPVVFETGGRYHRVLTLEKEITASLINYVTSVCDFVRFPLALNQIDVQPFRQNGFSLDDIEYTYVVDLDDIDRVWKGLNQDKRRKVKKGYKEGLACELSDNLDGFFPLWENSLAAHNRELSSDRVAEVQNWYKALRANNRTQLLMIKDPHDRIHAGAILVWNLSRAYYLLSGMNRDIASGNAMTLLLWECMRFAHDEVGVTEFDFDGSDVPSVERFFRGFGGRLTPRYVVSWGRPYMWPIRNAWKLITKWFN